jgi:hypothetical protein
MIFNRDVLFLHVPKTGGMAVTKYLLEILPRPVYYTWPDHDPALEADGVIQMKGSRHENLLDAREILAREGRRLEEFKAIIAAIRNPYHLEVSRFAYLRKGHPWDQGENQDLALAGDFEKFAVYSSPHGGNAKPIQSYFLVDGHMPANLKMIRTEHLEEELKQALSQLGITAEPPLPRSNETHHEEPMAYYTPLAEELVYNRYRWIFDSEFYPRADRDSVAESDEDAVKGPMIPMVGPVRQIGVSAGIWPDSWVGRRLSFRVRALDAVKGLVVQGAFPRPYREQVDLTLQLHDSRITRTIRTESRNTPIHLEFDSDLPAHSVGQIEIAASACWSPREGTDSKDRRQLSFRLSRMIFLGTR